MNAAIEELMRAIGEAENHLLCTNDVILQYESEVARKRRVVVEVNARLAEMRAAISRLQG